MFSLVRVRVTASLATMVCNLLFGALGKFCFIVLVQVEHVQTYSKSVNLDSNYLELGINYVKPSHMSWISHEHGVFIM